MNYKHGKTFISYYDKAMLLHQTDYLIIEINPIWDFTKNKDEFLQQHELSITVQINWKIKKSSHCLFSSYKIPVTSDMIPMREFTNYESVYLTFRILEDFWYDIWDKWVNERLQEYVFKTLPEPK